MEEGCKRDAIVEGIPFLRALEIRIALGEEI